MKLVRYMILLLFITCAFSCKKHTETPPDVGYDYAPTTIGKYIVYDVDSIVYGDFYHDTTYYKYRIKEKLEDNIIDNQGRTVIKLVRYIKKYNPLISYDNIVWSVKDVWTYTKTKTTLEVVEENVRYTKLAFPINEGYIWDGNAHNTIGEWDYTYLFINRSQTINGKNFDNILYVEQKDDKSKNHIHRQFYIEEYAKGVGLVNKEIKDLLSYTVTVANGSITPVEARISKGINYKLTYVTHGYE